MDFHELFSVASQALGIFLVVSGAWFAGWRIWPWFEERDGEQRARHYELEKQANQTQEAIGAAINAIAFSLTNPIRVDIEKHDSPGAN